VAASDHNLYLFEGKGADAFEELHITSVNFDEPRALALVASSEKTVTLHGSRIEKPAVYLSARDKKLEGALAAAFHRAGIPVFTGGHVYLAGENPANICNKNRRGQGVQVELSRGIRQDPVLTAKSIRAIREALGACA
jgi:phage replication-related protein YjqB (UPF0714/DUF867 family)